MDQGSGQVEVSQSDPHGEVSLKCNQHLIANTEPFKTQPDPWSMDADRLITSEPTMDQGSVLEVVCIKLLLSSQHNQKLSREFPNFKCSTTSQIGHYQIIICEEK